MKYWILIAVLVVIVFLLLKFKEVRHKISHLIIIVVILLTITSFAHLYLTNDLDLTTFDGIVHAGGLYFSCLGNVFHNTVSISGYAVHRDWSANASAETNSTHTSLLNSSLFK